MNRPDVAGLAAQFKTGMSKLASGVALITACQGDQRGGLIVTAVNSVSADPPSLLVCINETASAHDLILSSGRFCVNFLAATDAGIAAQFSSSSRRAERFVTGEWAQMASGLPALATALAAFDCDVSQTVTCNTHTLFIGTIREIRVNAQEQHPLVYLDRSFRFGASPQLAMPT